MKRICSFTTFGAAMLALMISAASARAQAPAALNQAPKDAQLVLVIPNLQSFSDKLANLKDQLNLPAPAMDDLLGEFKAEFGMDNGFDDNGSMLVVVEDLATALANGTQPAYVMLIPVTDYAAFIGNFNGQADGGLTALTMPGGQPGFAKQVGGFAVLSPDEIAVESYTPGNDAAGYATKAGKLGGDYLSSGDAALFIDIEAMAPALKPVVAGMLDQAEMQAEMMEQQGFPESQTQSMKMMAQVYGAIADVVLDGADSLVKTFDLNDTGIGFTVAMQTKPGSELARLFPGGSADASQLLAMLPDNPYVFASAIDARAVDFVGLIQKFLGAVPDEGPMVGMVAIYKDMMPMLEQMNGVSSVMYPPDQDAMMAGGFMNALTVYTVKDAAAFVEAQKVYMQKLNGLSVPMGLPMDGGDPPVMTFTTSYTENALEIEGVQVDQYQMQTNFPPEAMMEMGEMAGFMQMFAGGYNGYVATKGDKVIMTTALDPQLVTAGLAAADAAGGLGSAGPIAKERPAAIPPSGVMENYLSISGVAQTVNAFMGMMGMEPIQPPADLAPIAAGAGAADNGLAFRLYLPVDTIKFIADTAMQMQGAMMGPPPQGGGPGGPPPAPFN